MAVLPLSEGHANFIPLDTLHGTLHEVPGKLELANVFSPPCNAVLQRVVAAAEV